MKSHQELEQLRKRRRRDVGFIFIMAVVVALALIIEGLIGYILIDAVCLVVFFRWVGRNFPDEA